MVKIILILFLFSFSAFADDYLITVSSAEEVDSMFSILNAVAMIFHSEDYLSLLKLVALFGSAFVFMNAITGKLGTEGIKSFTMYQIFVVAVLSIVFSVSSTVYVKTDKYPLYYDNNTTITTGTAVANIPTVLAYSYSFFNSFGNGLTNLFQTAMSYSGNGNYSLANGGYVSSLRDSIDILNHKFNDSSRSFGNDVEKFVADCILVPFSGKGDEGQKRIDELYNSINIKNTLDSWYGSSIVVGNIPVNSYTASVNGDIYECGTLWSKLSSNDLNTYKDSMSKVFKNIDDRDVEVITKQTSLPKSNFEELAIQAGLINSFLSNSKLPTGIAYAEGKTKAEYIQTNLASGYYMSKMLPILQVVLRGLLYALFPLIVVLGLIIGVKIFKDYAKALLWIEMWGVCASILNFFILKYSENSFGGELTAYNSMQMLSDSAAIAGVAGYLYVSVPMISWGLMSGSFTMLSGVANTMSQSLAKNMSAMSISSDSKALQLKESVSQATGKDMSYAEALHYQNIQAGMKEGIEVGTNLNQGANFQNKLNYDNSKPYNELSAKIGQAGSLSNVLSQEGKKSSLDFSSIMGTNSLLTSQTAYGAGREGVRQMEAKAGMEAKFGSQLTEDSFTRANESTIKNLTRQSEIGSQSQRDALAKLQSKQDFITQEMPNTMRNDYNNDGIVSSKEMAFEAGINSTQTRQSIADKFATQEANRHNAILNETSSSSIARESQAKFSSMFGSGIGAGATKAYTSGVSDNQNMRADMKVIEGLNSNGVRAEDTSVLKVKDTVGDIQNAKSSANTFSNVLPELMKGESDLRTKALNQFGGDNQKANEFLFTQMGNAGIFREDLTRNVMTSQINSIQREGELALNKGLATHFSGSELADLKRYEHFQHLRESALNSGNTLQAEALETQMNKIDISGLQAKADSYINSSEAKAIQESTASKVESVYNQFEDMGVIKVDRTNGNVSYLDVGKAMRSATGDERIALASKVKGGLDGLSISTNDISGMQRTFTQNIIGENMTNISKATQEYSKTGSFNNDILYNVAKGDYVSGSTIATASTALNTAGKLAGIVGAGKFLTK